MNLKELKCINENVNLDDYYKLYNEVRNNMEHPEWLGFIPRNEVEEMLSNNGKIWLYYKDNKPICSMMYITIEEETLLKHNVKTKKEETSSLGPIMVDKDYIGNGLMNQMLEEFTKYNKKINKKYIFSKAAKDNIYSTRVLINNNYKITDEYLNERGLNNSFIKEL